MRKFVFILALLLGWAVFSPSFSAAAGRNLLWDGGFEIGYGNSYWGVVYGNYGPNFRASWRDGVLKLERPMGSRIYRLEDGDYYLAAWVKRGPGFEKKPGRFELVLTSRNYDRASQVDNYRKFFEIPEEDRWHQVGFPVKIQNPVNPLMHVELRPEFPDTDILVEAVSLTKGAEAPAAFEAAAEIEAGFYIPEETCTYVDGEERVVELRIRNNGAARRARVTYEIYNYREELVRRGEFNEVFPAQTTTRKRLPVADLPHNGYRLACAAEASPLLGDASVSFLPVINQAAHPKWGACANIGDATRGYTARLMKRLGMSRSYIMSASQPGRWNNVEQAPGKYTWIEEAGLDEAIRQGVEPAVCLEVFKKPPAYVAKYVEKNLLVDEAAYTKAVVNYVDAFVRHYAGRVKAVVLEDETGWPPLPEVARIYAAAYATAKKAARESKCEMEFGINGDWKFFEKLIPLVGPDKFDFLSGNYIGQPGGSAAMINAGRKAGWQGRYADIPAVGQRTLPRPTALIIDSPDLGGFTAGEFLWQHVSNLWLNRPYGTEDPKDGPILRTGYYDIRVMSASPFYVMGRKSGAEYDNSPALGFQAVAMLKHLTEGMRPARPAGGELSITGLPTANPGVWLYPFRNEKKALVALLAGNQAMNNKAWIISGLDFSQHRPLDFYGNPRPFENNRLRTPELPVYFETAPEKLDGLLAALAKAEIALDPAGDHQVVRSGPYILEFGPDLANLFQLRLARDGRELVLLDGLECEPKAGFGEVTFIPGRLVNSIDISLTAASDLYRRRFLTFRLTPEGVQVNWNQSNAHPALVKTSVRFRLGKELTGRELRVDTDGQARTGRLGADGSFTESAAPAASPLKAAAGRLVVKGLAVIDLPAATGQGVFRPATGLRFRAEAGREAALAADYEINPIPVPGSTAAIQKIYLKMLITADDGKK